MMRRMLNVMNECFDDEYQVMGVGCRQNHPISKTGINIQRVKFTNRYVYETTRCTKFL